MVFVPLMGSDSVAVTDNDKEKRERDLNLHLADILVKL